MRRLRYHLLDVFTDRPFEGNPLAVFTDGMSVPPELMPLLTRELNLSETTFVLPPANPANNYRVRIFTPGEELPMAGHPTVGTAYVLAREGMIERTGNPTKIVFEEGVGDIPVSVEFEGDVPGMIWMTQPKPKFGAILDDIGSLAEMLSLLQEAVDSAYPVQVVSTGVPFLFVPLKDLAAVKSIQLDSGRCARMLKEQGLDGLFVFTQEVETKGSTVHSRMFAPGLGINEDPATGGASGPLGAYLVHYGIVPSPDTHMISEQGLEMGRPSYIHIEVDSQGDELIAARIGGWCHYMGRGEFEL